MNERHQWIIDVCRTCDRLATWPFCSCREAWINAGMPFPSWYVAVRVQEVGRRRG